MGSYKYHLKKSKLFILYVKISNDAAFIAVNSHGTIYVEIRQIQCVFSKGFKKLFLIRYNCLIKQKKNNCYKTCIAHLAQKKLFKMLIMQA